MAWSALVEIIPGKSLLVTSLRSSSPPAAQSPGSLIQMSLFSKVDHFVPIPSQNHEAGIMSCVDLQILSQPDVILHK